MAGRKHAFLLFSKAPVPGRCKTRLTRERGGIFSPKKAAELYQASLLDVVDIGFTALRELNERAAADASGAMPDRYDLVVSSSPAADRQLLEELFTTEGPWPAAMEFIVDRGQTFDEHFDDAFRQLFARGYHSVVSIGGDLPTMPPSHIVQAFQWLDHFESVSAHGGFVQAPCQECGVSLVGYTADTPMDSTGVFYNLNGVPALDAYVAKAVERDVPIATLTPVADFDDMRDLAHTVSLLRAIANSSRWQPDLFLARRTLAWIDRVGLVISTPPNTEHDPREALDA